MKTPKNWGRYPKPYEVIAALEFFRSLGGLTMTTANPQRVGDYSRIDPFNHLDVIHKTLEELLGLELLIAKLSFVETTTPTGEVPGVAFTGVIQSTQEEFKTVSFSAVVHDQLRKVPFDAFPLFGKVTQQGQGARKYFSIS